MVEPSDGETELTDSTIEAIGLAVIGWSGLEYSVGLITKNLLVFSGLPGSRADTLVHNLDLRARVDIALPLAFEIVGNRALTRNLQACFNTIAVELRNKRNRIIHDSWRMGDNAILRTDSRAIRIVRPQANQLALTEPERNEFPVIDTIAFGRKCSDEQKRLNDLNRELLDLVRAGEIEIRSSTPTRYRQSMRSRLLQRIRAMFGRPPQS